MRDELTLAPLCPSTAEQNLASAGSGGHALHTRSASTVPHAPVRSLSPMCLATRALSGLDWTGGQHVKSHSPYPCRSQTGSVGMAFVPSASPSPLAAAPSLLALTNKSQRPLPSTFTSPLLRGLDLILSILAARHHCCPTHSSHHGTTTAFESLSSAQHPPAFRHNYCIVAARGKCCPTRLLNSANSTHYPARLSLAFSQATSFPAPHAVISSCPEPMVPLNLTSSANDHFHHR